jgi:selenocysteine-specific translation elongation factor
MPNLNVAVLAPQGYSEGLGKKGTSTDITFYNLKRDQTTVTFMEPSKYPERLSSLFFALSTAKKVLLAPSEFNSQFGEEVVALDALGKRDGCLVLGGSLPREKVLAAVKGTVVEGYEVVSDDKNALRERLLADAPRSSASWGNGSGGTVVVDHAFNVKGVGTVALGFVASGQLKVHDELKALPAQKSAQVRSIQKHDDDFDSASEGERVGLALKNIEVEDLERGTVLAVNGSLNVADSWEAEAELAKYWATPLKEGMVVHLSHWMQFVSARITSITPNSDPKKPRLTIKSEKPLVYPAGDRAVLTYLEGGKLRVAGTFSLS